MQHQAIQWILSTILILSSLGVILAKKPVYASLSFLLTLLTLSAVYLELSAEFIAIIQILVYAGAILVIFMFVIILFQDAYQQIDLFESKSSPYLLYGASLAFILALAALGRKLMGLTLSSQHLPKDFGMVKEIGLSLYRDFFLPFEALTLLFLIAMVGALYIGRKVK